MLSTLIAHVPLKRLVTTHALRLAHSSSTLRLSLSLSVSSHSHANARITRDFSTTPQRHASEDPNINMQAMIAQQQKITRVFQEKPELLQHVKDFAKILQEEGIDLQTGGMPTKMQMIRLFMKADVRDRTMRMMSAFQEAGIDLQSKEMLETFMAMKKTLGDGKPE
ncbi:hypothetical protein A0H81_08242 [Grifola frondosa]|uniref:Uncharacterized protein n=1 Tax=Grifola frondosa TaxID=5627 RepID=A0A1C7M4I8_GRIFR|nr:hypothetical protein A0H81_08242 [Grifola frondosa]